MKIATSYHRPVSKEYPARQPDVIQQRTLGNIARHTAAVVLPVAHHRHLVMAPFVAASAAAVVAAALAGCGGGDAGDVQSVLLEQEVPTDTAVAVAQRTLSEVADGDEQQLTPHAAELLLASTIGVRPTIESVRVFIAGVLSEGADDYKAVQRHMVRYAPATGSFVIEGDVGGTPVTEDIRIVEVDGAVRLVRDIYVGAGHERDFVGRSVPLLIAESGGATKQALAAAAATPAPRISALGGRTIEASDIKDGRLEAETGKTYNGTMVANTEPGLPWTVKGAKFGTKAGKVRLNGKDLKASWTDTEITIEPTVSWNANLTNPNVLEVITAAGVSARYYMAIAPAIKTRAYGQCAYFVARKRYELGLDPSPTAYGGYKPFDANYRPRVGDQFQVAGHSWIAIKVSPPVEDKKTGVTRWPVRIAEQNFDGKNSIKELDTAFVTQKSKTGTAVIETPATRAYSAKRAISYYR